MRGDIDEPPATVWPKPTVRNSREAIPKRVGCAKLKRRAERSRHIQKQPLLAEIGT